MESLRNAATAAASYVGLGGTPEESKEAGASHIAGGEAPQNAATGTSQSGVEPVSGKLGSGEGGEPYDAGNLDGAAGLDGSSAQNPSSNYASHSTSRNHGTGTSTALGHNTMSSSNTSSEPLGEKIRETFGVGGGNKYGTGLGSREEGPGYGTASRRDKDNTLGSVIGHGSNPDKYLYNSKTAPGLGGHRIGDDFTDANTRNKGADSLPASLGSDVAAGRAKNSESHSSSGLTSGRSENDRYSSGSNTTSRTGESLTQKAKEYLTGTSSSSSTASRSDTHRNTALVGATAAITGAGRNEYSDSSSTYASGNTSNLPVRTHDSSLTGDRSLASNSLDGAGVGGTGSGLTGAGSSGLTGGLTGSSTTATGTGLASSHSHVHGGLSDTACEAEQEGYKPHGGHPIGEAAHTTGQQTWLDYRNDPTVPVGRANPADL